MSITTKSFTWYGFEAMVTMFLFCYFTTLDISSAVHSLTQAPIGPSRKTIGRSQFSWLQFLVLSVITTPYLTRLNSTQQVAKFTSFWRALRLTKAAERISSIFSWAVRVDFWARCIVIVPMTQINSMALSRVKSLRVFTVHSFLLAVFRALKSYWREGRLYVKAEN